ncbi:MAG: hypothetical protein JWQ98_2546 [Chlorobi bacterium]|nr:hypothetical protein [Chlorobiota bacterium]
MNHFMRLRGIVPGAIRSIASSVRYRFAAMIAIPAMLAIPAADDLHAQGQWTASGFAGENVAAIAADTSGLMLAYSASGLFRSTDNGGTWSGPTLGNIPWGLAMGGNGVVYAMNIDASTFSEHFAHSSDGGITWESHEIKGFSHGLTIDRGGLPIIIEPDSLIRSTDGGRSWKPLGMTGFTGDFFDLGGMAFGPNNELVITNRGITGGLVYISTNDGTSWKRIYSARADLSAVQYTPAGTLFLAYDGHFIRSVSNGKTWTTIAGVDGNVRAVVVHGNEIYAMADGLYRSTDEGASWGSVTRQSLPENSFLTSLIVSASGDLFAATSSGLYRFSPSASVEVAGVPSVTLSLRPNPARDLVTILLPPTAWSSCRLEAFDMLGRCAGVIAEGIPPGTGSMTWNARGIPPGIYMVRMEMDGAVRTAGIILTR